MTTTSRICVLKFGSSVLRSEAGLPRAVHEIYREWRAGNPVVAVVSALGPTADDLLKRAEQLGLPPQPGSLAALLALALDRAGIPCSLLDPHQASLLTSGVMVIPGFVERDSPAPPPMTPLRVALLGCGTVGGGVLEHLLSQPDLFQVVGVAVRDRERARRFGLPRRLLSADPLAVAELDADVVIELLGGREPARRAIVRALELGRSVVTANKALLAEEIEDLSRLAERRGASLRYSASVGGALPALETARRLAGRVRSISGVLNGTCNYILDRWAAGFSFDEALAGARAAGFAEADSTLDLDGSDSAQKLALLAREAFGVSLRWDRILRRGIADLDRSDFEEAGRRGRVVRLVASCERTAAGLRASVQPLELPASHPLAQTTGAGNALRIETDDGEVVDVAARGAGRWPTSEAVLADLYDLVEDRGVKAEELEEGVA